MLRYTMTLAAYTEKFIGKPEDFNGKALSFVANKVYDKMARAGAIGGYTGEMVAAYILTQKGLGTEVTERLLGHAETLYKEGPRA